MHIKTYRTTRIRVKHLKLILALQSLCLASKNLKNTGLYLIRNVLSSVDSETKKLKTLLNENQIEVLSFINQSIKIINDRRLITNIEKYNNQQELDTLFKNKAITEEFYKEQSKKLKPGKLFNYLNETASSKDFWVVLDDTVLDQIIKTRVDNLEEIPSKALPAKASEQVRKQISGEFKGWLNSLASYKDNFSQGKAGNHTGRPKMPGYLDKNDLNIIKLFAGSLGKDSLPTIADRKLFLDYEKEIVLDPSSFEAYKDLDLSKIIDQLRNQLTSKNKEKGKLIELRIIPKGRDKFLKVFIEGVFELDVEYKDDCLLTQFIKLSEKEEIKDKDKDKFFLNKLSSINDKTISVCGADLGLNNLITLSFNQGDKGVVVSNQRLEKKIKIFDDKIDNLKASLTTPRQRTLQSQQDITPLAKSELIELRMLQKTLFNHQGLQHLINDRQNWLHNALHTASKGIVDLLLERNIQVLIVGRNVGWKDESNMGRGMNRRFHSTAHAEFIKLLKYKCEDVGILFIETEESFTSKTSFSNNIPLLKFETKDKPQKTNDKEVTLSSNEPDPQVNDIETENIYGGTRRAVKGAKTKSLHQFKSKILNEKPLKRWTCIHADMNGAYNIIRKVMPSFKVSNRLSSAFELHWISPSGLRSFRKECKNPNLNRMWASGKWQSKAATSVKNCASIV